MKGDLPAITGIQLIRLLEQDGFSVHRRAKHGWSMTKPTKDRTLVTIIPHTRASLDWGTLMAILGMKQTRIGRDGLIELIEKFGLK